MEDDMLPMGHGQVLPPLCPLQAETAVVGSQQEFPCGSIGMVTTGQEPFVNGFPISPHSIQIPHLHCQVTRTYVAILSKHSLDQVWSSEESPWICLAPKFQ